MTRAWSLRPATPADLPFLLELRLATMAPHFARRGRMLSVADHRERVERYFDVARIVECESHPVGLVKLVRDGRAWTLEQFQLSPALQGRGLGAALLASIVAEARAAGASIELGVLKGNPARRLYERFGFVPCAESEHGTTMILRAPHLSGSPISRPRQ